MPTCPYYNFCSLKVYRSWVYDQLSPHSTQELITMLLFLKSVPSHCTKTWFWRWGEPVWYCGEPAISLQSHHVSLVQWTTHLLPVTRDLGSKPLGGFCENWDSPVSIVSLHWWPRCDWSFLWPRLRRASSRTITRSSCWQSLRGLMWKLGFSC